MTYGINQPRGFQTARSLGAYANTGALNEYPITATNATAIFIGDLVTLSTLGTVQQGTASTAALGIFMGCKFSTPANQTVGTFSQAFWPGNPGVVTGQTPVALVADDPNAIWTIQETSSSGASGTPLTQGSIGLSVNIATTVAATAGNTTTGLSSMSINNASTATTVTNQNALIVALDPSVTLGVRAATPTLNGGQQTVGAFANWLVKLNTQFYAPNVRPV